MLNTTTPTCTAQIDIDLGMLLSCLPGLPEPIASMMWVTTNPSADLNALRILSQRNVGILRERVRSHRMQTEVEI